MHSGSGLPAGARIAVPTAHISFPHEIIRTPRSCAAGMYNIRRWTEMPAGGHFAALEQPEALVDHMRAFFRAYR